MDVPHAAVTPPEALRLLRSASMACGSSSPSPLSTGFSTRSFRRRARGKQVSMVFLELQELPSSLLPSLASASSTPSINTQQMRTLRLIADRAQFVLPLPEQMQSPGSHVRTNAWAGRLSGAMHGGNSRKHRRRDKVLQENIDEHTSEHCDRSMSSNDVFNDSQSHDQDGSGRAADTDDLSDAHCTADRLDNVSLYDSIHGDFWMNDPYFQELQAMDFRDGWQRVEDEIVTAFESFVDREGNGAALGTQNMINVNYRSELRSGVEKVHQSIPEASYMPFHEVEDAAEDNQESTHDQTSSGEYDFRTVESSELSSENLELQGSEIANLKDNFDSDSTGLEEEKLEQGTGVKALAAVSVFSKECEDDIKGASEHSGMARTTCSEAEESKPFVDAAALPGVERVGRMVEQVAELISDSLPDQQVVLKMVDQVSEALPEPVVEQVGQVAEQVTQTAEQLVEQVTTRVVEPISTTTSQIVNLLSSDEADEESEDEFEAYTSLDIPEFKGRRGLNNFTVLQEEQGLLAIIYNFYIFMLKMSLFEFFLGMLSAPILLSMLFTFLYIPQFNGLAFDETVREFMRNSDSDTAAAPEGLQLSWEAVFRVFMFSVSLSTGLQPELAPLSPYNLVVANLNALLAQLIFVFLSGAVFARLSQPSLPVKCSTVAIICPPHANKRLRKEVCHKAFLTRYVLAGPQPCELIDVKVDLTYQYNTITRSGTYFRTSQSLKLVRPEIAFLDHGMLVRHIIDETSPLYQRTQGMLEKEDAVFSLSVVGLERSSMESVFHVQHYCVHDKDVIWDAEFVDMILINKRNQRVVDHSLLSKWKMVTPNQKTEDVFL